MTLRATLMKPLALTLENESTHTLRNKIRLPLDVSKGKSSWLTKAIFTLEKMKGSSHQKATLAGETLSSKIFVGRNFFTKRKIRHFRPRKTFV